MPGNTKSPLKDRPLRLPGQSCEERRHQIFDEKLELPLLVAAVAIGLTVIEIWRSYAQVPPAPWVYASLAIVAVAFATWRSLKYLPEMQNLRLAADGERAVGQYLEKLRGEGYEVFHDIPSTGFNVDHVIIGPGGVFTIETKTWRKPRSGDARISFDGETLLRMGRRVERDPIAQAKAQASWLATQLEASTARQYVVRPVVLFPGWWVENAEGAFKDIWVLEPKALPKFLEREGRSLTDEQVHMASFHLSRYVRTFTGSTLSA